MSPSIPNDESSKLEGRQVGNYVLLGEIGRGGMGVIYLARHQSLDRLVAIKFLSESLNADPLYVDRFLREAKAAGALSHPGIVALYDAGSLENDAHYLVMEHVHGRDLHGLLREDGIFPEADAVEFVCQAAEALGYAHQKGFIHRDIKPENLVLTSEGRIKVCDLGLAKRLGEDGLLTQRGMVMGSPNYMSPERLQGEDTVDWRADIYSLGATLFHLLTGRIPYEGTPPVIMSKHLKEPLPDPRQIRSDLSAGLCEVIRKMMSKKPEERYQSMEQVVEALEPYRRGAADTASNSAQ